MCFALILHTSADTVKQCAVLSAACCLPCSGNCMHPTPSCSNSSRVLVFLPPTPHRQTRCGTKYKNVSNGPYECQIHSGPFTLGAKVGNTHLSPRWSCCLRPDIHSPGCCFAGCHVHATPGGEIGVNHGIDHRESKGRSLDWRLF